MVWLGSDSCVVTHFGWDRFTVGAPPAAPPGCKHGWLGLLAVHAHTCNDAEGNVRAMRADMTLPAVEYKGSF
jgi:hypothetical protein